MLSADGQDEREHLPDPVGLHQLPDRRSGQDGITYEYTVLHI